MLSRIFSRSFWYQRIFWFPRYRHGRFLWQCRSAMQEELGILVVGCPKKLSATLIYHSSDNGIEYFVPLSYFVRNIGNLGRPRFSRLLILPLSTFIIHTCCRKNNIRRDTELQNVQNMFPPSLDKGEIKWLQAYLDYLLKSTEIRCFPLKMSCSGFRPVPFVCHISKQRSQQKSIYALL